MRLVPTGSGVSAMKRLDLVWADILHLTEGHEWTEPVPGFATRRSMQAGGYSLILEPGMDEDGQFWHLLAVKQRNLDNRDIQTVGSYRDHTWEGKTPAVKKARSGGGVWEPRDLRQLLDAVVQAGWSIETTRKHYAVVDPAGVTNAIVPRKAGDHRAIKNAVAELRRAGLDLRRKGGKPMEQAS